MYPWYYVRINKSVDTTPAKKTYLPGPGSYLK